MYDLIIGHYIVMNELRNTYLGYELFNRELSDLPRESKISINTINQYSFCIANQDADFKNALLNSDVLLPDGVAIVVAVKATTGATIKKISGFEMHQHLLTELDKNHGSCFYLGASEQTLAKIQHQISIDYPNIRCGSFSPPFKPVFSESENLMMVQKINDFKADVVFVGMTAPKQEKWVDSQKSAINAHIICSIGAVFDFYAGTVNRPSKIWVDMGLEWFVRLCNEPKRLWKRYLYYGPVFVYILVREMIRPVLNSRGMR